jgi:large subunit ribosomal protein L4
MFTLEVKNPDGVPVGTVSIEKKLLGDKVRAQLMHEACLMYEANRRQGTACAKTRSEVAGSRTKPHRQKGTGRARAGTKQSPIWRGGGVAHGPRPRDFSYDIGKKARRAALRSALFSKFEDNEVLVIDELALEEPKTRTAARTLKNLGLEKTVLVTLKQHPRTGEEAGRYESANTNVITSFRNLPGVTVTPVTDLNAYEVLKPHRLLFTRDAFEALKELLSC